MIKWIRSRMYSELEPAKKTGHMFVHENKSISFTNLSEGSYPPFDCLVLSKNDVKALYCWLDDLIKKEKNENQNNRNKK